MIVPAILEKNWAEVERKLETCREFANTVHIDFIDGKFVDNEDFLDPAPFKKYSEYFRLEAHLMVEEPIDYLDSLSDAGFKMFVGHVEKMSDQVEFVAKAEGLGAVGLALNLETSMDAIKIPLEDLDRVLLMSIPVGFSGQKFHEEVLTKIKDLREKFLGNIEIDGGVNDATLLQAKNAGADTFCVTSFLFQENPEKQFRLLQSLL
jgi:ribulose-phosphate 3-epimerase